MRTKRQISRRTWLLSGCACTGAAWATPTRARGQPTFNPTSFEPLRIALPQLQYPGRWNPRPNALREWGLETRLRTRVEVRREPVIVRAEDPELFDTPFLYVAGEAGLPAASPRGEAQLRRFVDLGGIIIFDASDGGTDPGFERDVRALLHRALPGSELGRLSAEHVLYRSFYIVNRPMGRTRAADHLLAIQEEGRIKILFIPQDLGGSLARNAEGVHTHPCLPGGAMQREWATRLAINIVLYATCTDYKSDRAHVETLLRSRRWR
ncbi:MAG: DUF4159 domain-containing protein [Nannocystaceae bacterium]